MDDPDPWRVHDTAACPELQSLFAIMCCPLTAWSRIQPRPGNWDESAIERYRAILRGMLERGLTPLVSLHHYSDPLWLGEQGGWENEAVAGLFENYVRKVVEALKEYVSLWVTINEPNVYAIMGHILGIFPPGKNSLRSGFQVMTNQALGHARAYRGIHPIQPHARVGIALNYTPLVPAKSWSIADRLVTGILQNAYNHFFPAYIDTEGVSLERLRQMCMDCDLKKVLRDILFFTPTSFESQEQMINDAVVMKGIGLIVVDTITMLYRLHLEDDKAGAIRSFTRQMTTLQLAARAKDLYVLITEQVYTNKKGEVRPFTNRDANHMTKTMVQFDRKGIGQREATIMKHRSQPEGKKASFRISTTGLGINKNKN